MPRSVPEWVGRTPDSQPSSDCYQRLHDKQLGNCDVCGRPLRPKHWDADHIVSLKRGGENRESNLRAVCRVPCHSNKTARENSEDARSDRLYREHVIGVPKRRGKTVGGSNGRFQKKWHREKGRWEVWDRIEKKWCFRREREAG